MTRKELLELRRSSLLALKAYYSLSLNAQGAQMLNPSQITAAYTMHQAVCRELDGPDAAVLPAQTLSFLTAVCDDLDSEFGKQKPDLANIRHIFHFLSAFVSMTEEAHLNAAEPDQGGEGQ